MTDYYGFIGTRAPDWKWKRVLAIEAGDASPASITMDGRHNYEWISRASGFWRSYSKDPNPAYNTDLIGLYGDIYLAYNIFTDTETLFKPELEARVLARVESEEIAVLSGNPLEAIVAYEELFFDVRNRLDQKSYIMHYVIGKDLQNLTPEKLDKLWKLFGYFYGPKVLDAFISRTVSPQMCTTDDAVESTLETDAMRSLKVSAAIAGKHPFGGTREQKRLFDTLIHLMEVNKMADMSKNSSSAIIMSHIGTMLDNLSFSVGEQDPETKKHKKNAITRYMHTNGELKTDELLDASFTGESGMPDDWKDFRFPPLKSKKSKKEEETE